MIIDEPLGLKDYSIVWEIQKKYFNTLLESKLHRHGGANQYFITCEHPHVITLGKSGKEENIQVPEFPGVQYVKIDRGGDITYHGPGQLVVYPILDLENFGMGLKDYIYTLEQSVIDTLAEFDIKAGRIKEYTGVWLHHHTNHPEKIAAIGVKSSRHVTMHGLAFNIKPDLSYFDLIIPCGLVGKKITSLQKALNEEVNYNEVQSLYKQKFFKLFKN